MSQPTPDARPEPAEPLQAPGSAEAWISRRRFVESSLATFSGLALPACGGGGDAAATTNAVAQLPPAPAPLPRPVAAPAAGPAPALPPAPAPVQPPSPAAPPPSPAASGGALTTLAVRSTTAGTFPYVATVLPLRGQLPAGQALSSADDAALAMSVLSTHDDGSAAVVVVAGSLTVGAAADAAVRLQASGGSPTPAVPLTAAAVSAAVRSLRVDLEDYGVATLTDFARPERIWWANAQTICARYRLAAPRPAGTALEAVVDIHAHADGRALVEVVLENCKFNAATSTLASQPADAFYTAAVITINDSIVRTITTPERGSLFPPPTPPLPVVGPEIVVNDSRTTAPSSPPTGHVVLVEAGASGTFAGKAGTIATWNGTQWTFSPPLMPGRFASYSPVVGSTTPIIGGRNWPRTWQGGYWGNGSQGYHEAFRSAYVSAWVGGDPGLRVTQNHADLQQHPLFWKMDQASTADLSIYAGDTYTPWSTGRHNAGNMSGAGDHAAIGPVPLWEARFLQTGSPLVAKAVEASALGVLSFNINYRDISGVVPDATMMVGKHASNTTRNWPYSGSTNGPVGWELAHSPAAGLTAFICRPSPVFIELAQKIAVWNAVYNCDPAGLNFGWRGPAHGVTDMTGIFGPSSQLRGWAWGIRSLSHAIFLSPDDSAWKAGGRVWLDRNRRWLGAFTSDPKGVLNAMWNIAPGVLEGPPGYGGHVVSMWMYHFLIGELHRAAAARHLMGAQQAALDAVADWTAMQPVRYVNEQPNGGWRFIPYQNRLGGRVSTSGPIDTYTSWGAQRAFDHSGTPALTGPWAGGVGHETSWAEALASGGDTRAGGNYTSQFWAALAASVERGLPNANSAWNTVQSGITTLPTWRLGFGADPRWGATPRPR